MIKVTPMKVCYLFARLAVCVRTNSNALAHAQTYSTIITDILELGRHDLCSEVPHCDTTVRQVSCETKRETPVSVRHFNFIKTDFVMLIYNLENSLKCNKNFIISENINKKNLRSINAVNKQLGARQRKTSVYKIYQHQRR